jgi:hypothetical protein
MKPEIKAAFKKAAQQSFGALSFGWLVFDGRKSFGLPVFAHFFMPSAGGTFTPRYRTCDAAVDEVGTIPVGGRKRLLAFLDFLSSPLFLETPKEKMAAFIREAIERELARREAKKRPKK